MTWIVRINRRVTILSFAGIGKETAPFSIIVLISAWIVSILLEFSQSVGMFHFRTMLTLDDVKALYGVLAHFLLLVSNFMSPSSVLNTTPTSLIISAGATTIPVLVRLYSNTLHFNLPQILITICLGVIALHLSLPSQNIASQIHRITFPIATLLSSITVYITSTFSITSLIPALLMYYGIFTIPASPASSTLWNRLRYHPLLRKILHKDDSRKIFIFLCLNLGFMCVQMGYGIYTNSLGLVSDSIHMLVDCAAIAFGLAASVLADDSSESTVKTVLESHVYHDHDHDHTHDHDNGHGQGHNHDHHDHDHVHEEKQCHQHSHPHAHSHHHDHSHDHAHHDHDAHSHAPKTGKWAKLEDLAGFANGVFLVFVCLSILVEALGRLIWPEEIVEVEQLLIVSILGLAVNLVGVFSFNHGYPSSFPN